MGVKAARLPTHDPNVTNVTEGHNVTQRETPISVVIDSDSFDETNALAWQAHAGF